MEMRIRFLDRSQIKTAAKTWSFPVTIYAISRIVLYFSFFVAAQYFPLAKQTWTVPEKAIRPLLRWDAGWYLWIAEHGYDYRPSGQQPANFFPLYPMLIRALHKLSGISTPWSGIIISNLALLAALHTLNKAIRSDHGPEVAEKTLTYLVIFPSSIFFSSVYTESLFLFLSACSLYQMRQDRWLRSSLWTLLASLTRPTGTALALVSIWAFANSVYRKKVSWIRLAPLGAVLVGWGSYMTYLRVRFGDALLYFHAAQAPGWGRSLSWERMKDLPRQVTTAVTSTSLFDTYRFDVLLSFAFLLLTILSFRFVHNVYSWFSLGALLLPISSGTFVSMTRYVVVLFPCFVVLALLADHRPRLHLGIMLISTAWLACYSILFSCWYWVG